MAASRTFARIVPSVWCGRNAAQRWIATTAAALRHRAGTGPVIAAVPIARVSIVMPSIGMPVIAAALNVVPVITTPPIAVPLIAVPPIATPPIAVPLIAVPPIGTNGTDGFSVVAVAVATSFAMAPRGSRRRRRRLHRVTNAHRVPSATSDRRATNRATSAVRVRSAVNVSRTSAKIVRRRRVRASSPPRRRSPAGTIRRVVMVGSSAVPRRVTCRNPVIRSFRDGWRVSSSCVGPTWSPRPGVTISVVVRRSARSRRSTRWRPTRTCGARISRASPRRIRTSD